MDKPRGRHYPLDVMAHARPLLSAFLIVGALALPAAAAEPELFSLESSPPGAKLRVLDVAGVKLAESPVAASTWKLLPGDPVEAQTAPPERLVEIYTGTLQAPSLLCRVLLRYYGRGGAWIARFRLDEEPLVARVNGRWQPFELVRGAGGMLVRHGATLPNADGFFPTIEFGLSAGTLPIVAWRVVR